MNCIILDIFTDASIDTTTKLACAGIIVVDRMSKQPINYNLYLDPNSTNNRAEVMAIEKAVAYAVGLFNQKAMQPFMVNIISDSMISIMGVREWMLSWNATSENILLNSSGMEAANQSFFKNIFNMITLSGLKVKFYHQKGHVKESPNSLFMSEQIFYRSNGISVENAGLTPKYLADFNNEIDQMTRDLIRKVQSNKPFQYPEFLYYKESPMEFSRNQALIETYKSLIQGGINYPIH